MDDLKELETLVAEPVTVMVAGEAIVVRPLTVGKLPAFIRQVRPFIHLLDVEEGGTIDLMELVDKHGEAVIEAVAIGTGQPAGTLRELQADDFLQLAGAVLEVNTDFFARRLLPTFLAQMANVMGRLLAGRMPSNSSGTTDTPSH